MRLARVILSKPIRLPGSREPETEITDDMVDDLRYDEKLQVVVIGDVHRPREQVTEWTPASGGFVCEDCGQEFANEQGLGGHRAKKHGVGKGAA